MIEAIYAHEHGDRDLPTLTILERRFLVPAIAELRAEDDEQGKKRIVGLIPFNKLSQELPGGFKERILPTAFSNSLADDGEIWGLLNHDKGQRHSRRSDNSLKLRHTPAGLYVSMLPSQEVSWGRDALGMVKDNLADGLSFGFNIRKAHYSKEEDGTPVRNLEDIDLREVSVVYDPAYRDGMMLDTRSLNFVPESVQEEVRQLITNSSLAFYQAKQKLFETY